MRLSRISLVSSGLSLSFCFVCIFIDGVRSLSPSVPEAEVILSSLLQVSKSVLALRTMHIFFSGHSPCKSWCYVMFSYVISFYHCLATSWVYFPKPTVIRSTWVNPVSPREKTAFCPLFKRRLHVNWLVDRTIKLLSVVVICAWMLLWRNPISESCIHVEFNSYESCSFSYNCFDVSSFKCIFVYVMVFCDCDLFLASPIILKFLN